MITLKKLALTNILTGVVTAVVSSLIFQSYMRSYIEAKQRQDEAFTQGIAIDYQMLPIPVLILINIGIGIVAGLILVGIVKVFTKK